MVEPVSAAQISDLDDAHRHCRGGPDSLYGVRAKSSPQDGPIARARRRRRSRKRGHPAALGRRLRLLPECYLGLARRRAISPQGGPGLDGSYLSARARGRRPADGSRKRPPRRACESWAWPSTGVNPCDQDWKQPAGARRRARTAGFGRWEASARARAASRWRVRRRVSARRSPARSRSTRQPRRKGPASKPQAFCQESTRGPKSQDYRG